MLSRQNSKFVIDDAQPLSFQVVNRYALNAEHVHARSLQKLHLFDWHLISARPALCTVFNVGFNAPRISTVSYIHWRGVPQGPGRGRRPRPGSLRYTPTVNVGKLFSHAPRMAQITAANYCSCSCSCCWFPIFPPGREIPGLDFPARRLPRKYRQIHPGR